MFNTTQILIEHFVKRLLENYKKTFGGLQKDYGEIISWTGAMALEIISSTDAMYHNVEHTILVTLVGQEILRGKHFKEGGVTPEMWLHFTIATLCHDIGYIKGVCTNDKPDLNLYCTGIANNVVKLEPGATDAALTHHHVDRGKQFVRERFGKHHLISAETICAMIELTRFPVPKNSEDKQNTKDMPGLVRAADLLGQLADPRYLTKIPGLFYEFVETGTAKALKYETPDDLRKNYPKFYWSSVYPYVKDGIRYLQGTQEGREYLAFLYANVFAVEHQNFEHPLPQEQ